MENKCIYRLKLNDGFKEFNSELDLKDYLTKNNIVDSDWIKIDSQHQYAIDRIDSSIEETKRLREEDKKRKINLDEDDVLDYGATSTSIGVSDLLKVAELNGKQLILIFKDENFQSEILKKQLLTWLEKNNIKESVLKENELYTVDNILSKITNIIKESSVSYKWTVRAEDIASEFESNLNSIIKSNFKLQLQGEVLHKIISDIIKFNINKETNWRVKSSDFEDGASKTRFIDNVFASFKLRYELDDNTRGIIEEYENDLRNNNILMNYFESAEESIKAIKARHKGSDVKYYSEIALSAKMSSKLDNKEYLKGKLDILIIDDGKPYIYDIKVSKKDYEDWDSAKKITVDYQQGFYRSILNNLGLNTNDSPVLIVPFKVNLKSGKIDSKSIQDITLNLRENTNISQNINEFLPTKNYDLFTSPEEYKKIEESLKLSIPGSSIVAQAKQDNKNLLINALIRISKNKKEKFNWTRNGITIAVERSISGSWDIEKAVNEFMEKKRTTQPHSISHTKTVIQSLIKGAGINNIRGLSADQKTLYKTIFSKYFESGSRYKIIQNLSFDKLGVIGIHDSKLNSIDMISLSEYPLFDTIDMGTHENRLLDLYVKNKDLDSYVESEFAQSNVVVPKATHGNMSLLKAYLLLSETKELKDLKAGRIIAMNSEIANYTQWNSKQISSIMGIVLGKVNNRFLSQFDFVSESDIAMDEIIGILNPGFSNENSDLAKQIKEALSSESKESIPGSIKKIMDRMESTIQGVRDGQGESSIAYNMLNTVYLYYQGIELSSESSYNKSMGQWLEVFDSFLLNSMDTIGSENLVAFRNLINPVFSKVRRKYIDDFLTPWRKIEKTFKDSKGFSVIQENSIGNNTTIYKNLYEIKAPKPNDDYSDMYFKNPWVDNTISQGERDYIKKALFYLNKDKLDKINVLFKNFNEHDLDKDDYLVPLMLSSFSSSLAAGKITPSYVKDSFLQQMEGVDDDYADRVNERADASEKLEIMYNRFGDRRNLERRKTIIEKNGINKFELNTELLVSSFIMSEIRTNEFQKILPQVRAIQHALVLKGMVTKTDTKSINEFIFKYMKSVVYSDTLIEDDMKWVMKGFSAVKNIAGFAALNWNVINIPREILMGFWENISSAMFKKYGKNSFGMKDYMNAMKYMSTELVKFPVEVTKIEMLNQLYAMGNMDIDDMVGQTMTFRKGFVGGFGRWGSWALTAPDYWNRMSIFIAQMIKDGCFQAHSVEIDELGNEYLKYDMNKDSRYDVFARYRNRKSAIPTNLKDKFEQQYGLYIAVRDEFVERDGFNITENGDLPQAYTSREAESFKSFADMSFGYYDKETKALFNKTTIGMFFKMFMTYLSAKKAKWLLTRGGINSQGRYVSVKDAEGNQVYKNPIYNNKGEFLGVNTSIEKKDDSIIYYKWEGRVMEGVLQSYVGAIKDLRSYSKYKLSGGKEGMSAKALKNKYTDSGNIEVINIKSGTLELLMWMYLFKLFRLAILDDEEESGISHESQVENSGFLSRNAWNIFHKVTSDIGPINALKSGVWEWQVPAISIVSTIASNFNTSLGLDNLNFAEALLTGTVNSMGMLSPFRVEINDAIRN